LVTLQSRPRSATLGLSRRSPSPSMTALDCRKCTYERTQSLQ
jgi:hypothetical protein